VTDRLLRYDFASDNTAGMCPEALDALVKSNSGFSSGYGSDRVTAQAAEALRRFLDADAEIRFVASGTAANAIACATLCQPFEAVIAHRTAHICTDETGAPGFFGQGLGIIPLPGENGKIELRTLESALSQEPEVPHRQSPAALSLNNVTECGTVYREEHVRALINLAKSRELRVHLDGSRLINAVAAGFDSKALQGLGIDILIVGGTKAGAPLSEAIVLFNRGLCRRFDARLKQAGQLPSKSRFLAAPWIGLLNDDAWLRHAAHANTMARVLAARMPHRIAHSVDANSVFVQMEEPELQRLRAAGWRLNRFHDASVRFMCSWATTEAAVEEIANALNA
jgi:threonine aldolase